MFSSKAIISELGYSDGEFFIAIVFKMVSGEVRIIIKRYPCVRFDLMFNGGLSNGAWCLTRSTRQTIPLRGDHSQATCLLSPRVACTAYTSHTGKEYTIGAAVAWK